MPTFEVEFANGERKSYDAPTAADAWFMAEKEGDDIQQLRIRWKPSDPGECVDTDEHRTWAFNLAQRQAFNARHGHEELNDALPRLCRHAIEAGSRQREDWSRERMGMSPLPRRAEGGVVTKEPDALNGKGEVTDRLRAEGKIP